MVARIVQSETPETITNEYHLDKALLHLTVVREKETRPVMQSLRFDAGRVGAASWLREGL